jgi:hypothetical protein
MIAALLVLAALLVVPTTARALDDFQARDGHLESAYMYPYSDGGFVEEGAPPQWEMPGPFSLVSPPAAVQRFTVVPSFRNQQFRIEAGSGFGYINSMFPQHPFQVGVETTWSRLKNQPPDNRNFRRVRITGNGQLWRRTGHWESTAVSATGFFQNNSTIFNTVELGSAVTEVIGQRLSVTGNGIWRRRYLVGTPTVLDAGVASFGTSYNIGAGLRFGGFYELWNQVDHGDDWGMFLSYQFLPRAEFIVDGGKFQFVRARLIMSYIFERPQE